VNLADLKQMAKLGSIQGLTTETIDMSAQTIECPHCKLGAMREANIPKSATKDNMAKDCGERILCDITGPIKQKTKGGSRYLLTFTDQQSKYRWGFLLPTRNMDQILSCYHQVKSIIKTHWNTNVKYFRADNEFNKKKVHEIFKNDGTIPEFTIRYSSFQNGGAERGFLSIFNCTRASLSQSKLSPSYWGYAAMHSIYTLNQCLPSNSVGQTPHEIFYKTKPHAQFMRPFGISCFVAKPAQLRNGKLDDKGIPAVYLGKSINQKGFMVLNQKTGKVITTRTLSFFDSDNNLQLMHDDDDQIIVENDGPPEHPDHDDYQPIQNDPKISSNTQQSNDSFENTTQQETTSNDGFETAEEGDENVENGDEILPSVLDNVQASTVDIGTNIDPNMELFYGTTRFELQDISDGPVDTSGSNDSRNIINSTIINEDGTRRSGRIANREAMFASFKAKVEQRVASLIQIPKTVKQAQQTPEWDFWLQAMKEECKGFDELEVYEEIDSYEKGKPIGARWVFAIKETATGHIERFKARLVAKGYTQVYGKNYFETHAPVAKMESIKILLSIVALNDLELYQADVKQAFCRPELKEEVIMKPPWLPTGNNKKLWLLKRAIYGLKQSARAWNQDADTRLKHIGFTPCLCDPCIYVRKDSEGKYFYIALYVDDMLYAYHDVDEIRKVHSQLEEFWSDFKWMGEVQQFLGMNISRDRRNRTIHLSQERILYEALQEMDLTECNPTKLPYDMKELLVKATPEDDLLGKHDKELYHTVVGKLLYVATNTRPDLGVIASQLGSYVTKPTVKHLAALKKALRFCKGTITDGIVLGGDESNLPVLVGYSDADWAGDRDTRKSRTGYVFLINSGCITWQTKKQPTIALSTSEAELMSLSSATQELRWLIQLLSELGFTQDPILLYQDNQGCIQMAKGKAQHSRSKHIDIKHKHVEQAVEDGLLTVPYIPSKDMLADIMTKPLAAPRYHELRNRLGLQSRLKFLNQEADDNSSKEAIGMYTSLYSFLLCKAAVCT
jgi:hypothetical protein